MMEGFHKFYGRIPNFQPVSGTISVINAHKYV